MRMVTSGIYCSPSHNMMYSCIAESSATILIFISMAIDHTHRFEVQFESMLMIVKLFC